MNAQTGQLAIPEAPEDLSDLIASCHCRIKLLLEYHQYDYQRMLNSVKRLGARSLELEFDLSADEAATRMEEAVTEATHDPVKRALFELSDDALRALDSWLRQRLSSLAGGAA